MENENETDVLETAETEVNWETRARELEEKAKLSREKNKEYRSKVDSELNTLKEELKSLKDAQSKAQPTELDYGKLAFFEAKGLTNPDDVKVVEEEASRLKLPYTDVLGMQHIQAKLQANREERTAKEGLPGGHDGSGANPKGVDYYLAQGEGKVPMTPDGNIDQELAEKVIEARIRKETTGNQFKAPL